MSNPSFSNIDQWFFELQEGNLSPQQIAQLKSFVMQHPELDVDKDMWELSYVASTPLQYAKKNALIRKKPIALYWSLSSAASILLVISYFVFSSPSKTTVTSNKERQNLSFENRLNGTPYSINQQQKSNISIQNMLNIALIQSPEFIHENAANSHATIQIAIHSNLGSDKNQQIDQIILDSQRLAAYSGITKPNTHFANTLKHNFKLKELNHHDLIHPVKKDEVVGDWKLHRKSVSHSTFSTKMRLLQRAIERMVDNPIALKNLKDPHYHVPGMQAVDVNFGAVGTLLSTRVQTTTRYQWMGGQNEQLSNQLLIDGYAYAIRGGVGLQVIQSNYHNNSIQETFAAVTYSPKFSVSKNVTVEPALRYKMGNNRIDPSALKLGQTIEFERNNARQFYSESESPKGKSLWFKDLGLSVMVNTKWFYAGVQFDNLTRHENNIYSSNSNQRSPIHSVLTIGTDYESVNKNLRLSPYLIYQNYGNLSEAWLGTNFGIKWFNVGAAISSNLEPAASIGMKFKHFAMTYNADYTQSMMTSQHSLSHQLTLRFNSKPSRIGQRLLNY